MKNCFPQAPSPLVPMAFQVHSLEKEIHDTFTMTLSVKKDKKNFSFQPGQFNMLYVFGVGESAISISGDPMENSLIRHTIRVVGSVTRSLLQLKVGGFLGMRGPFGRGWPMKDCEGKDVVVVAGGIGLAPLRPVLYQLLSAREKYGRIILLYGARTPSDVLYKKELKAWGKTSDVEVLTTVDRAVGSWRENVGVVTELIPRVSFRPDNSVVMVCGPEVMMRFTAQEILKRGVRSENIFVSMERNMQCAVGFCGHCQFGPHFICKEGPVFPYPSLEPLLEMREL